MLNSTDLPNKAKVIKLIRTCKSPHWLQLVLIWKSLPWKYSNCDGVTVSQGRWTHQHCFHYYLQTGSFFSQVKNIFFSKQKNKNVHYSTFDISLLTDLLKLFIFTYFGLCASEKSITQKYTRVQLLKVFIMWWYKQNSPLRETVSILTFIPSNFTNWE